MQHEGKPETCPFFATFLINKKATGGQLLKINHKHGYIPKYSNKYNNKTGSVPPKSKFQHHQSKVILFLFNDTYDSINTRDNTHEYTPLVSVNDEHIT